MTAMTVIDAEGIRALLRHREPMLLVDQVDEAVPGARLRARKLITETEPWDPESGYPTALLIESWGQSAALLAALDEDRMHAETVLLFGGMSRVRPHGAVFPGELLEHHVSIERDLGETVLFTGHSEVAGRTVLEVGQAMLAFRPRTESD